MSNRKERRKVEAQTKRGIGERGNKRSRPPGDMEKQLEASLFFLQSSCEAFDRGFEIEASRIALELRKLLHHNGGQSHSILHQLGYAQFMNFYHMGSYPSDIAADMVEMGLVDTPQSKFLSFRKAGLVGHAARPDGTYAFAAPLGRSFMRRYEGFGVWWKTPLIEGSSGAMFSRSDLIMIVANQNNGAHVDPTLDGDYQDLCADNYGLSAEWSHGPGLDPINSTVSPAPVATNLAEASIRQIAHEVLVAIKAHKSQISTPEGRAFIYGFAPDEGMEPSPKPQ